MGAQLSSKEEMRHVCPSDEEETSQTKEVFDVRSESEKCVAEWGFPHIQPKLQIPAGCPGTQLSSDTAFW